MCLIIHKPTADAQIDDDALAMAELSNPDGFGITFLDGDCETIKTMDYSLAFDLLYCERPYVAHYRYATVGKVSERNCHPFQVPKHAGQLYSNGTVSCLGSKRKTDTQAVAKLLGNVPQKYWPYMLKLTDTRFAYVSPKGKVTRFGRWHLRDGVYYSKDDYFWSTSASYGTPSNSGVGFSGYDEETGLDSWQQWAEEMEEEWNAEQNQVGNYSPSITIDDWNPTDVLAVYGTLKRGYGNHNAHLRNATYLGKALSCERLRMQSWGIPYVYRGDHVKGHNIEVELYLVESPKERQAIDDLEGHPDHYTREKAFFMDEDLNEVSAWIYYGNGEPDPKKAFIKRFD